MRETRVWVRRLVVNVTVEAEMWGELSMRETTKAVHNEEEGEREEEVMMVKKKGT